MTRLSWRSICILAGVWLIFAAPFYAVGADDVEDFYTGVASTKMAVDSMAQGAWPFWSMDTALGVPQPFEFHFISHPFSALCHAHDCARVLRGITAVHLLIGALFMALLVGRLTADDTMATVAGVTLLFSSSIMQPIYVDDWSTAAICESALPVLIYGVLALLSSDRPREKLRWSLALGGLTGFVLSMFFPFAVLAATALFAIVQPKATGIRWRWFLVAAAVTAAIGSAHVYHLAQQYLLTPADIPRPDHKEPSIALDLWSTFARPFPAPPWEEPWRTIFFGPPLAVAATVALFSLRDRALRPFRIAFAVSVVLMWVPEWVLMDVMTNRWGFRSGINVFGIVLGACGIARWRKRGPPALWVGVIAAQVLCLAATAMPSYAAVARAWLTPALGHGDIRVAQTGIVDVLAELVRARPGRVAFSPAAYDVTRNLLLARDGLSPNQLQMAGIASLNAEAHGITLDALSPMTYVFIGRSPPTDDMALADEVLDVLGVRYVLAMPGNPVSERLRLVRTLARGLRVYENPGAWPEAFFVARFPAVPLPRRPGCGHDRFLCADFGRAGLEREAQTPVTIERRRDGMTLRFASADQPRNLIVTQWYQPAWRVVSGAAQIVPAAEQLVGLRIAPGADSVTIEYLPVLRATLFFAGLVMEIVVLALVILLSVLAARDGQAGAISIG